MSLCFALVLCAAQAPDSTTAALGFIEDAAGGTAVAPPQETKPAFSYSYVELGYLLLDSDGLDETVQGWRATGSFDFLFGSFLQATYTDASDSGEDYNEARLGVGYHLTLSSSLDLFGIASYARQDLDGSNVDDVDGGGALVAGARYLLTSRIELNGQLEWVNLDESDGGAGVGARYYLTDYISFGANVRFLDNDEELLLGVRLQF
ncbi:MAG: hypothetical protein EYC70_06015 [Planctomycetota bacterium]|nr:MAG: hypothetical protein EYC70_06015 [Planctomycetota bacterium]